MKQLLDERQRRNMANGENETPNFDVSNKITPISIEIYVFFLSRKHKIQRTVQIVQIKV
jgi:hypothetical protein